MAVTIKQIAEAAGVSRGTVDRALNNRPGVNAEVAARIRKIAEELHYQPNAVAKALARSQKRLRIGVLLNSGGNSFFDKVILGVRRAEREIESFGATVVLEEMTGYRPEDQLEHLERLVKSGVDGLVLSPINDPAIVAKLNEYAGSGLSITTLNTDVTGVKKLCFVGCDYLKSGQTAAELLGLMTTGDLRVGIVTGSFKMLGHNQRIEGFRQVLEAEFPRITLADVAETNDDDDTAYDAVMDLLIHQRPDALYFCAGGLMGGIRAVRGMGLEGKIKIITVDDTENVKELIREGIVDATVCQQPVKQGYEGVMTQYRYLADGKLPKRKHLRTQNEVKLKYNLD